MTTLFLNRSNVAWTRSSHALHVQQGGRLVIEPKKSGSLKAQGVWMVVVLSVDNKAPDV